MIAYATDIIKPYQMIQYAGTSDHFPIPDVESWKGNMSKMIGVYIGKFLWINNGNEPPMNANKGDLIEYREYCHLVAGHSIDEIIEFLLKL